jgi:pilus assembly protein Flp/PilA
MKNLFVRFVREDEGQDIIEYALLAAFISVSAWLLLGTIGSKTNSIYQKVGTAVSSAESAVPTGS